MKKLIAGGMALVAALSFTASAFAADKTLNTKSVNGQVEMIYNYLGANNGENSYVVTIPEKITVVEADTPTTLGIAASDVYIVNGKRLVVTLDSQNDFKLKKNNSSIPYTCKLGENEVTEATKILIVNGTGLLTAASSNLQSELKVNATTQAINGATETGAHTDMITFQCAVESVA